MHVPLSSEAWTYIPISRIEDLRDAVYGAGLEATQMSADMLSGGIAFAENDGVLCSSGLINGRVSLFGPLSQNMISLGIGVRLVAGTRHWLNEVETGNVGVFLPCDDHDSLYTPGSIYASVSLMADRLEEEAAKEDLILDRKTLGGTGVHARSLTPNILAQIQTSFERIHSGDTRESAAKIGKLMLTALIEHLARPSHLPNGRTHPNYHGRIVARARAYILEHLCEPMSVDEIAAAAYTSRRTLFRAFADVLDDTPRTYVRRLRLHRIRHDLADDAERACTIALIANQWGISDLGRMSGSYRELFGERPSDTLAHPPAPPARKLARTP